MSWHSLNEKYLVNRIPLANVGVVWSQLNTDFYGREAADQLVDLPMRGITQALIRARIPFLPVHADHIERDGSKFLLLILPNIGAMSTSQAESVRRFVGAGGHLIATGETSLYNEWGDPLSDYALAGLYGAHVAEVPSASADKNLRRYTETLHTYLRILPGLRKNLDGPHNDTEPEVRGVRHPVLKGFEETDILPFGGILGRLRIDEGTEVPLTFIPAFPIYPPETAWMRVRETDIPGLILNRTGSGSRIAFIPADIDRQFARYNLPDHGNLLANIVRWAVNDDLPLRVDGPGLIDCHLYRKQERLIVHIVNLTSAGTWRQPVDELIPVGPLKIRVRIPEGIPAGSIRLLVMGSQPTPAVYNGWCTFEVSSVKDHEVAVIG